MLAEAALHRELAQEQLELRGFRFSPMPPLHVGDTWTVFVYHNDLDGSPRFDRPQRHDAMAQALQWAAMQSFAVPRDTQPAPAMEVQS